MLTQRLLRGVYRLWAWGMEFYICSESRLRARMIMGRLQDNSQQDYVSTMSTRETALWGGKGSLKGREQSDGGR